MTSCRVPVPRTRLCLHESRSPSPFPSAQPNSTMHARVRCQAAPSSSVPRWRWDPTRKPSPCLTDRYHPSSCEIMLTTAIQGTGRMALYGGLHPAQLKDSVTSKSTHSDAADSSPGRMHDRGSAHSRGRQGALDDGARDPGRVEPVSPGWCGCRAEADGSAAGLGQDKK